MHEWLFNRPLLLLCLAFALSLVLHWNFLGNDIAGIHAWRQTQTMTVVENFATEDLHILNPRINSRGDGDGIFRMEFPLMQWTFAWFYKWFGEKLIIARLLTFCISAMSVLGFYRLLRAWDLPKTTAAGGAWCLCWSPVLFYYAINPLPDNLALCFGIWSLAFLKRYRSTSSTGALLGFGALLSLATAVKLPFILFGTGFIPLFIRGSRQRDFGRILSHSLLILLTMTPAIVWYLWVIPSWGNAEIISGTDSTGSFDYVSALNTIWGTLTFMLIELFVNYGAVLFFIFGIVYVLRNMRHSFDHYQVELSILLACILFFLYEVNVIGLAHDYYLFPFLPIIFLVVTKGMSMLINHKLKWLRAVSLVAIMVLPLTAYLRTMDRWTPSTRAQTLLTHKQDLRNVVPDDALVVAGNDISHHIMLYHIGKKGWVFNDDRLTAEVLSEHIENGATYLYSNTDGIYTDDGIASLLEELLFEENGLKVYSLKQPGGPE